MTLKFIKIANDTKKQEIIGQTELLLNALNQGDYETYSRLCDPHMTSFEPESCGLLIDNMQYRRLCLDQVYQMQLQFLRNQLGQQHQQLSPHASNTLIELQQQNDTSKSTNLNTTEQKQVCVPATQLLTTQTLSLANFNMTTSSASMKRYSLIVNPSVHLMGSEAASIAYTKLDHYINLQTMRLQIEQTQETRIWHLKGANTDSQQQQQHWQCIHLHSSRQQQQQAPDATGLALGPQLNQSLLRHMNNQQLNALTLAMQQDLLKDKQSQLAAAGKNVPIISLNHSSHGSGPNATTATAASANSTQPTTAPR